MTDEIKNGIQFDREYWPCSDTILAAQPFDLNDLWSDDTKSEKAEVFIAEALIRHGCNMAMHGDFDIVSAYLWSVGGDCLVAEKSMLEMLEDSWADLPEVRSETIINQPQYERILESIETLNKLRAWAEEKITKFTTLSQKWVAQ